MPTPLQMLESLEENAALLNDWEVNFVDSLQHQLADKETPRNLSTKQYDKLKEIWHRINDE